MYVRKRTLYNMYKDLKIVLRHHIIRGRTHFLPHTHLLSAIHLKVLQTEQNLKYSGKLTGDRTFKIRSPICP